MTNAKMSFTDELNALVKGGLLPDNNYLSTKRFFTQYENSVQFESGILKIGVLPIINGLAACMYGAAAIWATMRAVGNLLILKPGHALDAFVDCSTNLSLSLLIAVMAPIHALTDSVELLTRIITSWFIGKEPQDNLSKLGLPAKISAESNHYNHLLLSSTYFQESRFFSPYKDVTSFLGQLISPANAFIETGFSSLSQALKAVISALNGIANVIICKPKHALEDFSDLGVHLSLSFTLAVMTPINTLIESLALLSRLGSTWVDACLGTSEEKPNPSFSM
ncbi:hypothetical protein [Legionella drancourtii]|uniref:Uncharacterized protein n=1 Tax=Legionella drancourtii LLAP12 TaxID=658187 RepID=G9ERP1_9GAMM|nr:hypothetical protein [Legionella drancourtii]EHL30054.1 hypothetical protein LDG_7958 [Legionella drancourtii LLAP12]